MANTHNEPVEGLLHALVLDGKGSARQLDWEELGQWQPDHGVLWVHFDYTYERSREWIETHSGLDEIIATALLTEETRPRSTVVGDGLLLALRGVNMNPNADPEDMVSIRLWVDAERVVSTRRRRVLSAQDLRDTLIQGRGPHNAGDVIAELTDLMVWRMGSTVADAEDAIDVLEERVLTAESHHLRADLSGMRRQTIMLRRYLSPQRDALAHLAVERVPWLSADHRLRLREVNDRLMRHLEDLDAVRDRAAVTQEELASRLAEQLNNRMYVLSIVAAVFLPLGFLTGLLGINVGGIPGSDEPYAFTIFVVLLLGISSLQFWVFRRLKWF